MAYSSLRKKGSLNAIREKCVALTELHLDSLTFNQHIYDRCRRHIIYLIDDSTGEEVSFKLIFFLLILSGFHAPRSRVSFFAYLKISTFSA